MSASRSRASTGPEAAVSSLIRASTSGKSRIGQPPGGLVPTVSPPELTAGGAACVGRGWIRRSRGRCYDARARANYGTVIERAREGREGPRPSSTPWGLIGKGACLGRRRGSASWEWTEWRSFSNKVAVLYSPVRTGRVRPHRLTRTDAPRLRQLRCHAPLGLSDTLRRQFHLPRHGGREEGGDRPVHDATESSRRGRLHLTQAAGAAGRATGGQGGRRASALRLPNAGGSAGGVRRHRSGGDGRADGGRGDRGCWAKVSPPEAAADCLPPWRRGWGGGAGWAQGAGSPSKPPIRRFRCQFVTTEGPSRNTPGTLTRVPQMFGLEGVTIRLG